MVRTTDCNFIVTVPGRVPKSIALVAHYDTWAGFSKKAPGADDNTSGEEVLKQYLLRDFLADSPPPLTHVYLFAGSEGMRYARPRLSGGADRGPLAHQPRDLDREPSLFPGIYPVSS